MRQKEERFAHPDGHITRAEMETTTLMPVDPYIRKGFSPFALYFNLSLYRKILICRKKWRFIALSCRGVSDTFYIFA